MSAQVEELGENRVRLTVDVSPHELEHAVEHATNDLSESVKIPGFRKGKVPTPVLISKIGKDRIWVEAVESHISGWFWSAASRTRLRPISAPEYDFELPTTDKEPWTFSATIEVQPTPEIVDWTTLEVPRAEAEVPQELVDQELEALRQSVAELVPADDRPAKEGDTLVVDLQSPSGEAQSDTVVELGFGRLVEEIEAALIGASVGETKEIDYELADESGAAVTITVKHVNEKVLPELDDELAKSASEFDTFAELKADIEGRVRTAVEEDVAGGLAGALDEALRRPSGSGRPGTPRPTPTPGARPARTRPGTSSSRSPDSVTSAQSRSRTTSAPRRDACWSTAPTDIRVSASSSGKPPSSLWAHR